MKSIFLSFVLLLSLGMYSCNNGNANNGKFKKMAGNDSFKNAHEAPLPMVAAGLKGEMIYIEVAKGKKAMGYLRKSETASTKYLFIFHEWWGLNDYIKKEVDSFAKQLPGTNVLAIDMYDGQIATTPEKAGELSKNSDDDRIKTIILGAIKYAGDKAEIATLGWCFGGGYSLQATILGGAKIKACVMYYGLPEESRDELKKINAPVLGIFGTQDKFITPQVVKEFQANMKAINKPLEVKSYDAVHAFANPSNPKFNKEAADDARKLALSFLNEHLFGR